MYILTVDQARSGGYSIWDYDDKRLMTYGSFNFPTEKFSFPQAVHLIENTVETLVCEKNISAVFIEDINLRGNVRVFKQLAQLQGVLINMFEKTNTLYDLIAPSTWQNYCNARGRTTKEVKDKVLQANIEGKKKSKVLSIEFIHNKFHVDTNNDNVADAICMGWYVVNNVKIEVSPQVNFKE